MSPGEEPSNRRLPWLGALLILTVLGVLIWQAREAGPSEGSPATFTPAPGGMGGRLSLGEMLAHADSLRIAEPSASAVAFAASQAAVPKDQVEVCGAGRVMADESGQPVDMKRLVQQPVQEARARLLLALAHSPDEAARAAGLLIQSAGTVAESPDAEAVPAAAGVRLPNSATRDALVNMALATRLPQVYAFALQACATQRTLGMCQMLSTEQWARLDPGNAAPWVQLMHEARERGDAGAVSEAMFRASQARTSDPLVGSVLGLGLALLPADTPPLVRVGLSSELMGLAIGPMPTVSTLNAYCGDKEQRDANRQQTCAAVAEVLTTRGTTLVDLLVGTSVGERSGWPAERVERLRDERDAMAEVLSAATPEPRNLWSCDALQRMNRYLGEVGRLGEMGALRGSLKQAPESVAELARRHRDKRAAALQLARAATAASAAQP